jgi:hypothetical protein
LGDGIKFIEEKAVADHGTSAHSVPNRRDSNAVRILIIDVDSSDLRCSLNFSTSFDHFVIVVVGVLLPSLFMSIEFDLKSLVTVLGCLALMSALSKMVSSCQQKSSFQLGDSSSSI